ncbi:hypothetical protein [Methylobacterium segetis]|nr:hypothetical protein [Methylobacterium segetis]
MTLTLKSQMRAFAIVIAALAALVAASVIGTGYANVDPAEQMQLNTLM